MYTEAIYSLGDVVWATNLEGGVYQGVIENITTTFNDKFVYYVQPKGGNGGYFTEELVSYALPTKPDPTVLNWLENIS